MCLFSHLFSQNNPTLSEVSAERHTRGSRPLRQLKVLCSGRRFATRRLENRPHRLRVLAVISLGCSDSDYTQANLVLLTPRAAFVLVDLTFGPFQCSVHRSPVENYLRAVALQSNLSRAIDLLISLTYAWKRWSSLLCFRLTSCPYVQNLCPVVSIMPGLWAWTVLSVVYSTAIKLYLIQLIVKEASSFIRCRYLTSSQLREGRKTQRRGSSPFSQVIACTTTPPSIRTDPHINNVDSGAESTGAGNLCLSWSLCWQGNTCDCSLSVVAACPRLWTSLSHGVCSHIDRDCATVRPAPGSPAAQLGRDQWSVFRTVKCLGELTEIRLITVLCARGWVCLFTCTFPRRISGRESKRCKVKRKSCCVFTVKWCILVNAVF